MICIMVKSLSSYKQTISLKLIAIMGANTEQLMIIYMFGEKEVANGLYIYDKTILA